MKRVYPPIEPQLTVGEYLDRFIVKYPLPKNGKFTTSYDPRVESFWATASRIAKRLDIKLDTEEK